jgi:hypothetical protein
MNPTPARDITTPDETAIARYTYRVERDGNRVYTHCIEADAIGEGTTETQAVESLREALRERLFSSDAIAPPPVPPPHAVVLVNVGTQSEE